MLIDDEAARHIVDRLDALEAADKRRDAVDRRRVEELKAMVARQKRQEDIGAEHHEDIKAILASLDATSAAVRVLMHAKYGSEGEKKT